MKTVNQRTATVSTILAVLEERGENYVLNGEVSVHSVLTDKDKDTVRKTLFAMFRSGEVEMSADAQVKYQDDKELNKYISGLVNNWIRKAPEFNNSQAYKAKNPGSRPADEQIKEMKRLLALTQKEEDREVIEQAIADRLEEIKPTVQVDASKLPEALKQKLGIA